MNKKGQVILLGIMLAFVGFVMLVALMPAVKYMVDDARTGSNLNCASSPSYNASATTDDALCLAMDFWMPAYFGTYFVIVLVWIGGKIGGSSGNTSGE